MADNPQDFSKKIDAGGRRIFRSNDPAANPFSPPGDSSTFEVVGDSLRPRRSGRVSSEEAAAIRRASRFKFHV